MSKLLDYSKFDNIGYDSDSESDGSDTDAPSIRESLKSEASGRAERDLRNRGIFYEVDPKDGWLVVGKTRQIRIHPDDSRVNHYSGAIFSEDPNTFVPERAGDERVHKWGLGDVGSDGILGLISSMMMSSDGPYNSFQSSPERVESLTPPDHQFMNILIKRRERHINSQEVVEAMNHTYVIKVELCENEADVWRKIKVPSDIDLSKLHDQVLCPAMGWSRAYHGYVFEDPKDGAVIGPPKKYRGGIDWMHAPTRYGKIMTDRAFPLAALMQNEGDTAYYTYDLGDMWEHRITLEGIIPGEADTVTLLDGEGSCPPEDGNGLPNGKSCGGYAKFLAEYKKNPKKLKMKEVIREVTQTAINYKSPWMGGPPLVFRPLDFDIEYHRRMMRTMLAGPSVKKKPVQFDHAGDGKFSESMKGCGYCGNRLKTLSKCSACKKVSYCSKPCQVNHWGSHKTECKKHRKAKK